MARFKINNTLPEVKIGDKKITDFTPRKDANFFVVPEGFYNCKISEVRDTNGFSLFLKIVDGDCKSKVIFQNFKFDHDNEKLVWVHKKIFREICLAIGFTEEEIEEMKTDTNTYMYALQDKYIRVKIKHTLTNEKTYANIEKSEKLLDDRANGRDLLQKFKDKKTTINKLLSD